MDHVEYTYTTGLSEEELDQRLQTADFGVLSLAREGEAYAIPVSFHYDDGRVLLRLGTEDRGRHRGPRAPSEGDSEKIQFLEATDRATVLLYEAPAEDESWSVLLRGPIRPLSEEERAEISAADVNEWFAPFRVFDEAIEDVSYELYELDPDSVTGRTTMEPN